MVYFINLSKKEKKILLLYIIDIVLSNKIFEHILIIYIYFVEIINNWMFVYDIVFLINIVYKYNGL